MPLSNDFIEQFSTPGDAYRPHIMWFWNAPLEEDEVRRQVRDFRGAGILDFYIGLLIANNTNNARTYF